MKTRLGSLGVHLFDRASGLNILFDEARVDRAAWSTAPRYMSIALANACDLHCAFCYASKAPNRLAQDRVLSWALELDANGCFGIGFGGGEPTLYPRFSTLCRNVHTNSGLAITMTTHGHWFTPALVTELTGAVSFIRLSMDGIGRTYERIRGRSFTEFLRALKLVRATSRFGINYVVNADTIDDLPRAAEFAFASGAEELLLLPETSTNGQIRVEPGSLERLSEWVAANYRRRRIAMSAHGAEAIDAPILPTNDHEHGTYDFMHIDAAGILKVSAFASAGIPVADHGSLMEAVTFLRQSVTNTTGVHN